MRVGTVLGAGWRWLRSPAPFRQGFCLGFAVGMLCFLVAYVHQLAIVIALGYR